MTEPGGGAPPPPEPNPATPPPAGAGAPPPAGAGAPPPSNWQSPPPASQGSGFQTAPVAAGPAPGVTYADTVMRVVAYIIDSILLGIVIALVAIILIGIMVGILSGGFAIGLIILVIVAIIALLGSAFYFVYFWTTLRASPGQKILGLETVNAADGATLALRRLRSPTSPRWALTASGLAAGPGLGTGPEGELVLDLGGLLGRAPATLAGTAGSRGIRVRVGS